MINSLFLIFNYAPLGKLSLQQGYIPFIKNLVTGADSYPALFMTMFLFIPFLNKLIRSMNKKEYTVLLCLLLFFFSIISTFFWRKSTTDGHWYVADNWEGLGWYSTVYLIGGYIRKYFSKNVDNLRTGIIASAASLTLSCLSIVLIDYSGILMSPYFMLCGANKFLAIVTAVSLFILFKNIRMPDVKFINLISSSTFGVLLIHANSDTMRYLLWTDIFKCTEIYEQGGTILIVKACADVLVIYAVCVCIALLVNKFIQAPILNLLKRNERLQKPLY